MRSITAALPSWNCRTAIESASHIEAGCSSSRVTRALLLRVVRYVQAPRLINWQIRDLPSRRLAPPVREGTRIPGVGARGETRKSRVFRHAFYRRGSRPRCAPTTRGHADQMWHFAGASVRTLADRRWLPGFRTSALLAGAQVHRQRLGIETRRRVCRHGWNFRPIAQKQLGPPHGSPKCLNELASPRGFEPRSLP